jgi:hypothetical protein
VSEIYYEAPNPEIGLPVTLSDPRWLEVFAAITEDSPDIRGEIMEQAFSSGRRNGIRKLLADLVPRRKILENLKGDETQKEKVGKLQAAFDQDLAKALSQLAPGGTDLSLKEVIERGFETIASHAPLFTTLQRQIETLAPGSGEAGAPSELAAEVKRIMDLGIVIQDAKGAVVTVHSTDQLSSGERYQLRALNLLVMSQILFPKALERSLAPAYVDPRLTTPKPWRDVMRYDARGNLAGWVRFFEGRTYRFDTGGKLLPDGALKPDKSVPVTYTDDGKGHLKFITP